VHHRQNDNWGNGFVCARKGVEGVRNDISRQTIEIVWDDGASDANKSIPKNQIPSLDVPDWGILGYLTLITFSKAWASWVSKSLQKV
jgi:hypothetical protein